ncbi:MAG: phenylalanine--tRNA ligase subunit alpha [Ferrimicrobium sp.]
MDDEVRADLDQLTSWISEGCDAISRSASLEELGRERERWLGRESLVATLQRGLRTIDHSDRPTVGQAVGNARSALEDALAIATEQLSLLATQSRLVAERDDLTAYLGRSRFDGTGSLQLATVTRMELEDIFVGMGFQVADGPEVETDWHNFEALNIPKYHPARDSHDSFYLALGEEESRLLRTHTSPVQIRLMSQQRPPIYAVAPGRVYRRDTPDARHTPAFHQIEGLVVDEGISFAHLAGTIDAFTRTYFGAGIASRLRPAYFPFTEPSAEFEITCTICKGAGCRTCSGTGWIELGGSGMVHPRVFEAVGIDPERYSGFAFGFGIDRLAQMRAGLADMRVLPENDIRLLSQFGRLV